MLPQEIAVLENIQKIDQNQGILLDKPKTPQQELLHIFGQRFLLNKKMLHKNIEQVLNYQEGTFGNLALKLNYMSLCLESHIELSPEHYPVLKKLISWNQFFNDLKGDIKVSRLMLQNGDGSAFNHFQEFMVYVNYISKDIINTLKKSKKGDNSEALNATMSNVRQYQQKFGTQHLDSQDLLAVLNISLPKVLYNILLNKQLLPSEIKQNNQTIEILFKNNALQYFLHTQTPYSILIKILLKFVLNFDLKPHQQKELMDIVFRYFFAFHHDKKFQATDLFIQAYNKLAESTRIALSNDFLLFFKMARKVGKGKFVDFLIEKSELFKEITSKVTNNHLMGYSKQGTSPFNHLGISESIYVESGKTQSRTFQVLEDYSIVYFKIEILSHDINFRLYYLGDFKGKSEKTLVLQNNKVSGLFHSSIVAKKRGLYLFEFDNTYSWINSKNIRYENVILSPLELKSDDTYKWVNSYFNNTLKNQIVDSTKILIFHKKNVSKQNQAATSASVQQLQGTANITKNGAFFNLKIVKSAYVYEFQTQNEEKFIVKFKDLVESAGKVRWLIKGQPIEDPEQIDNILSGKGKKAEIEKKEQSKQKVLPPKKEVIEAKFVEEEEQKKEQAAVAQKPRSEPLSEQTELSLEKTEAV